MRLTRLTFERQSTTQDAIGQLPNTWTGLGSRLCEVDPLSGTETMARSGEVANVAVRISVAFDKLTRTLRESDRVVNYGVSPAVRYNIVSIVNVKFDDRTLVLQLSKFLP